MWPPPIPRAGTNNTIKPTVADGGGPPLSATNSFIVVVRSSTVTTPPVIQSIAVTDGQAVLSWSAVAGKTYRLQFIESLSATEWTDVAPDITASGSTAIATNLLRGAQH